MLQNFFHFDQENVFDRILSVFSIWTLKYGRELIFIAAGFGKSFGCVVNREILKWKKYQK